MPFTHANTSDYSAPQTQEAASCGQKQCKQCGKNIDPFYYAGINRVPLKRVFCSKKCSNASYNASEKSKKYREVNRDRKNKGDRERRALTKYDANRIRARQERYRRESPLNRVKNIEKTALFKHYGTCKLPKSIIQRHAIIHIGKRASMYHGNIKPISKEKIFAIISRIQQGETYAAYE